MRIRYHGRHRNGVTIYWQVETSHIIEWVYSNGHCYQRGDPSFNKLLEQHFGQLTCYDAGVF